MSFRPSDSLLLAWTAAIHPSTLVAELELTAADHVVAARGLFHPELAVWTLLEAGALHH